MLRILLTLALAPLPASRPAPLPGFQETGSARLLDFTRCPEDAARLITSAEHRMVPESGGPSPWSFAEGVLTAPKGWESVLTPDTYADFRMHVEFRVNRATNENRETNGNSGVYLQERYEVQILDSFGIPAADYQPWDCGSLYRLKKPDRPACRRAGVWQSYDILFRAARFEGDTKVEDARITVFQNDVLIHEDVALPRKTGAGKPEGPEPRPIKLQGHGNPVGFRSFWVQPLELDSMPRVPASDVRRARKDLPRPGETFPVAGCVAFVIEPVGIGQRVGPQPWVWYAPTLPGLPGSEEGWMIDRLLSAGIAVAGIDVGESYGSPTGTERYRALHAHLTATRGYSERPVLLARSRGGLMLYNWAVEHPGQVAGIAGIYPVCNLASYPGLDRAAPAYGLTAEQLGERLAAHNPIERLVPLARARVPILHLHGDRDTVVPLEPNSAELAERYTALGGPLELALQEGRGHDMWQGWFRSEALAEFMVERARAGAEGTGPVQVYILSGQSNMVGIGQVSGRNKRWGSEFIDPVVSVYTGPYSEGTNYSEETPIEVRVLPDFGGGKPTPFPGGGTHVVRGYIQMQHAGTYEFSPGYGESSHNRMNVGDVEVYRREVGAAPMRTPFAFDAGELYPFEIVFFTEAADGLGWITRTDVPGTLTTLVKTEGQYPHLVDEAGRWVARDDVWYKGLITATADQPLSPGCGANPSSIGPELQFGNVLGDHHEEPVLILKTSQGNRSLGWDFLPPGGERFTFEGRTYAGYGDRIPSWTTEDPGQEVDWYAGKQYDDCFTAARDYLDAFDEHFPHHAERGYVIAGFAWWQGHKDGNPAHASRYEQNLVHLIHSLRADFEAPRAPFVIGTIGFGGWDLSGAHLAVANAQLAVSGTAGHYPEFEGDVLTVETRDFWREATDSPRNQDFHYHGNAGTYLDVGNALGHGMLQLLRGH